jgi:hypothetical protein
MTILPATLVEVDAPLLDPITVAPPRNESGDVYILFADDLLC